MQCLEEIIFQFINSPEFEVTIHFIFLWLIIKMSSQIKQQLNHTFVDWLMFNTKFGNIVVPHICRYIFMHIPTKTCVKHTCRNSSFHKILWKLVKNSGRKRQYCYLYIMAEIKWSSMCPHLHCRWRVLHFCMWSIHVSVLSHNKVMLVHAADSINDNIFHLKRDQRGCNTHVHVQCISCQTVRIYSIYMYKLLVAL